MLGAAYGDALGWPNERISKSKTPEQPGNICELKEWKRREGGRFYSHEEIIKAGEYSDDTQLILCVSRSLQRGDVWWDYMTQVELPFWSIYERGGGGATKRAVESWSRAVRPWAPSRKSQDVTKYFDAGGNGVAMRILPHVLFLHEHDFSAVALNIFLDGITTHGHPNALLGALVYGYALWSSVNRNSTLAYGELIDELLDAVDSWSVMPDPSDVASEWQKQSEVHLGNYANIWESSKNKTVTYLRTCKQALSKGALCADTDVLKELQCFSKDIGGAGTVSAIASIFLASRHAAAPINGITKAAHSVGIDTDTIASMTGGLLGCIGGADWLPASTDKIQDISYLRQTAMSLASKKKENLKTFPSIKKNTLNAWRDEVITLPDTKTIDLPDGRNATVCHLPDQHTKSDKHKIQLRMLRTEDEQTIYVKKISKHETAYEDSMEVGQFIRKIPQSAIAPASTNRPSPSGTSHLRLGPKVLVSSIEQSVRFYKELLGLTVKKQTKDTAIFHQGLVLMPHSYTKEINAEDFRSLIYVEITDIKNRYECMLNKNVDITCSLSNWKKSKFRFFRCLDPDKNLVEVFEKQ